MELAGVDGSVTPLDRVTAVEITPNGISVKIFASDPDVEWELPRQLADALARLAERQHRLTRDEAIELMAIEWKLRPRGAEPDAYDPPEWIVSAIRNAAEPNALTRARTRALRGPVEPTESGAV